MYTHANAEHQGANELHLRITVACGEVTVGDKAATVACCPRSSPSPRMSDDEYVYEDEGGYEYDDDPKVAAAAPPVGGAGSAASSSSGVRVASPSFPPYPPLSRIMFSSACGCAGIALPHCPFPSPALPCTIAFSCLYECWACVCDGPGRETTASLAQRRFKQRWITSSQKWAASSPSPSSARARFLSTSGALLCARARVALCVTACSAAHRWNKEQLFDRYYANPAQVQKEAGVRSFPPPSPRPCCPPSCPPLTPLSLTPSPHTD